MCLFIFGGATSTKSEPIAGGLREAFDEVQVDRLGALFGVIVDDPDLVVVQIDGVHEVLDHLPLEGRIRRVSASELLEPVDDLLPGELRRLEADGLDPVGDLPALLLELLEAGLRGLGDDPLLDGGHHVLQAALDLGELLLEDRDLALLLLPALEIHDGVGDPLDDVVDEDALERLPDYELLDPLLSDRLFVAGPPALLRGANVIVSSNHPEIRILANSRNAKKLIKRIQYLRPLMA